MYFDEKLPINSCYTFLSIQSLPVPLYLNIPSVGEPYLPHFAKTAVLDRRSRNYADEMVRIPGRLNRLLMI